MFTNKMMFTNKILWLGATAMALSACGGGGGTVKALDSSVSNTSKPTPALVELSTTYADTKLGRNSTVAKGSLNTLRVNGVDIELVPAGIGGNLVQLKDANGARLIDNSLKYAKHGSLDSKKDGVSLIFHQGQATPVNNVPKTGSATYRGNAVYSMWQNGTGNGFYQIAATSELQANFANKKIAGAITSTTHQIEPVHFSGDIAGNTFTVTGTGSSRGIGGSGGFYGHHAEEVAGIFGGQTLKAKIIGSFGGKK